MRTQIALYISKNTVHTYTALYIHYVYNTALAFMAPYKNTFILLLKKYRLQMFWNYGNFANWRESIIICMNFIKLNIEYFEQRNTLFKIYDTLSTAEFHSLMRWRETQNALQLSMFFSFFLFFCQTYQRLRIVNRYSWF